LSRHRHALGEPMWSLLGVASSNDRVVQRRATASGTVKRQPDDLEVRVSTRKRELITEIIEHKKNSSRWGAAEAIDRIGQHLAELSSIVKTHEWTKLSPDARLKLADWVAR
jgi:hypothetical protein